MLVAKSVFYYKTGKGASWEGLVLKRDLTKRGESTKQDITIKIIVTWRYFWYNFVK